MIVALDADHIEKVADDYEMGIGSKWIVKYLKVLAQLARTEGVTKLCDEDEEAK